MEEQEELILEETPEPETEEVPELDSEPDFAEFVRAYPGMDPKTIPQSVWDAVQQGENLLHAYRGHEVQQLKSDNMRLQQQLGDLDRQTQLRARSLGSVRSTGAVMQTDGFLQGFDEA